MDLKWTATDEPGGGTGSERKPIDERRSISTVALELDRIFREAWPDMNELPKVRTPVREIIAEARRKAG